MISNLIHDQLLEIRSLREENANINKKLSTLQNELKEKNQYIHEKFINNEENKIKNTLLLKKINELENYIQELKNNNIKLINNNKILISNNDILKQKNEQKKNLINDIQNDFKLLKINYKKKIDLYIDKLKSLDITNKNLLNDINHIQNQKKLMEVSLDILTHNQDDLVLGTSTNSINFQPFSSTSSSSSALLSSNSASITNSVPSSPLTSSALQVTSSPSNNPIPTCTLCMYIKSEKDKEINKLKEEMKVNEKKYKEKEEEFNKINNIYTTKNEEFNKIDEKFQLKNNEIKELNNKLNELQLEINNLNEVSKINEEKHQLYREEKEKKEKELNFNILKLNFEIEQLEHDLKSKDNIIKSYEDNKTILLSQLKYHIKNENNNSLNENQLKNELNLIIKERDFLLTKLSSYEEEYQQLKQYILQAELDIRSQNNSPKSSPSVPYTSPQTSNTLIGNIQGVLHFETSSIPPSSTLPSTSSSSSSSSSQFPQQGDEKQLNKSPQTISTQPCLNQYPISNNSITPENNTSIKSTTLYPSPELQTLDSLPQKISHPYSSPLTHSMLPTELFSTTKNQNQNSIFTSPTNVTFIDNSNTN